MTRFSRFLPQLGAVCCVAVAGDALFAGHAGGCAVQWDLRRRAAARTVRAAGGGQWVRCVAVAGGCVVTGSAYGVGASEVAVWSLDAMDCLRRLPQARPRPH